VVTNNIDGKDEIIQMGMICVTNDKVNRAMMRSGHNGAVIYTWERDEDNVVVNLPRKTTMATALEASKRVGELSMGVVYNIRPGPAWALRVKKDDQAITDMKAKLDPELAEEVGRSLMAATLGVGKRYILKNIEAGWTFIDVVKMLKASLKWSVRPERFLKGNW